MNLNANRNEDFIEDFNFKNDKGEVVQAPPGGYKVILERGEFAKEYTTGAGLVRMGTSIRWTVPQEEVNNLQFATLYYTLFMNDQELIKGVLRING